MCSYVSGMCVFVCMALRLLCQLTALPCAVNKKSLNAKLFFLKACFQMLTIYFILFKQLPFGWLDRVCSFPLAASTALWRHCKQDIKVIPPLKLLNNKGYELLATFTDIRDTPVVTSEAQRCSQWTTIKHMVWGWQSTADGAAGTDGAPAGR